MCIACAYLNLALFSAMAAMTFSWFFFFFILWTVSFLLVSCFLRSNRKKSRPPPRPFSLPLIGHLHLLTSKLPLSFQALARRYGPLMQIRIGQTSFIVASSAAMAKEIFKTQDTNFSSRFEFGPECYNIYAGSGFITGPYGSYWRFMKKIAMTKLFAGPQLERFSRIREEEICKLLQSLVRVSKEEEACNLSVEISTMTNSLFFRTAMKEKYSINDAISDETKSMRTIISEIMELAGKLSVNQVFGPFRKLDLFGHGRRLVEALWRYDELVEKIMTTYEDDFSSKRDKEETDLMDIILETYRNPNAEVKITRNQIKFFFLELFMASIDSLSAAIQWTMGELINHPEVIKRLRVEIDSVVGSSRLVKGSDIPHLPYLQAIIKEALRLHMPGPLIHRQCTSDCKLNGYDVKATDKILINVYAIMRDSDNWTDPDEFVPERFMVSSAENHDQTEISSQGFRYLPFGGGRRVCAGASHASTVMHATVGALIQCFDWKVKGGDKVDITVGSGFSGAMATPLLCYPKLHLDPNNMPC